jgi:hypothetical protein
MQRTESWASNSAPQPQESRKETMQLKQCEKTNLRKPVHVSSEFFLWEINVSGNLTIFYATAWGESGNADLRIGGLQNAIQENGVPGKQS